MASESNARPLPRLIAWSVKQANWLSWLFLLLSAGVFAALPLMSRKVFFDENALLPGNAHATFSKSDSFPIAKAFQKSFLEGHSQLNQTELVGWLAEELQLRGFDTSIQRFTGTHNGESILCENLHGILRSSRGDGKEGMVLVTPLFRDQGSWQSAEGVSVALGVGIGLLTHLSTVTWLAKDLIWVLTDSQCGGVESMTAWLEQYHAEGDLAFQPRGQFLRGGVLQQAFVLEMSDGLFDVLELSMEGQNGELPKLDVYWLPRYMSNRVFGAPSVLGLGVLSNSPLCKHASGLDKGYMASLNALSCSVLNQAIGVPTGSHAPFKKWGVDAVTIRPRQADPGDLTSKAASTRWRGSRKGGSMHLTLSALGNTLELIFRSCNSLLEKLHHSYFYYIFTSTDHFVTIDLYILPYVFMTIAVILQASKIKANMENKAAQWPWKRAILTVVSVHVTCAVCSLCTRLLLSTVTDTISASSTLDMLYHTAKNEWLAVVSGALAGGVGLFEIMKIGKENRGGDKARGKRHVSRCLQMVLYASTCMVLAAFVSVNWALTFVGLSLMTPIALALQPHSEASFLLNFGMGILLLCLSPVSLLAASLLLGGIQLSFSACLQFAWLCVVSSPIMTFVFWTSIYVPFWIVAVMIAVG